MTRVFSLLDGKPSGFGIEVHPEKIRVILGKKEAQRLMRQLLEVVCPEPGNDPETSIILFGSWVETGVK